MPRSPGARPFPFNRNIVAAAHDAAMAALSFVLALALRLGDMQQVLSASYFRPGIALFTLTCVSVFLALRLYRGLWRYASMRDLIAITRAVSLAILIFALLMFLSTRSEGFPRSAIAINWLLLLAMLGGPRFLYRAVKDRTLSLRALLQTRGKIPVILIGATGGAEQFIREMNRDPLAPYEAVAIADDSPARAGRTLQGVPIYGGLSVLSLIVAKLERKGKPAQKIVLADESIEGAAVRDLLKQADAIGLPLARLPRLSEFRAGLEERPDIRPIAIEDLLGRAQNVLDRAAMRALVQGRRVLVSGAGGSIGSELCRQIAGYGPARLLLLESNEFNLYQIERELRGMHANVPLTPLLANVRERSAVEHVFARENPQLVFHTAAIKHVPMAEANVEETVLTNVFGTKNIADACARHEVAAMVLISTDKAVNPANVMGATKRLAESYCQALGQHASTGAKTTFITVRFGNVLGSTGSVVPLFQEQLARRGPLTVTHPGMTRYFMTLREAVELVLQAAALGMETNGRRDYIFVLDMGQPVRIMDLAEQMIRLAGLRPNQDIAIVTTGLRPGEKLFEELFYLAENTAKTRYESILLAQPRTADLNGLERDLALLLAVCERRTPGEARRMLRQLVPEFQPQTT